MNQFKRPISEILNELGLFNTMARMKKSRFTYNIMMKFWEMPQIYTPEYKEVFMGTGGSITTDLTIGFPYTTIDTNTTGATTINYFRSQ